MKGEFGIERPASGGRDRAGLQDLVHPLHGHAFACRRDQIPHEQRLSAPVPRQPQREDLGGERLVGAALRQQQGGAGPQDAIQRAMLGQTIHEGLEELGRGERDVELRIVVGAVRRLLQQRHHLGVGGEERLQRLPLGRRERPGRVDRLRIQRHEPFLDRVQVGGGAAEGRVRVLLGGDRLPGEVRELHRVARPAERPEAALEPCSGAPDVVRVEHQQDDDRGSRGDPDPFEEGPQEFHRRFPRGRRSTVGSSAGAFVGGDGRRRRDRRELVAVWGLKCVRRAASDVASGGTIVYNHSLGLATHSGRSPRRPGAWRLMRERPDREHCRPAASRASADAAAEYRG